MIFKNGEIIIQKGSTGFLIVNGTVVTQLGTQAALTASVSISASASLAINSELVSAITTVGGRANKFLPGSSFITVDGRAYRYIAVAGVIEGGGIIYLSNVITTGATFIEAIGDIFFGDILRSSVSITTRATIHGNATLIHGGAGQPQNNLMLNPSFESLASTNDWTSWNEHANGGTIEDTALSHTGDHAVKLTYVNSPVGNIDQAVTVTPQTNYSITFWTRGDGIHSGRFYVYDLTHLTFLVYVTDTKLSGTTYQRCAVSFTTPAGCNSVRIRFYPPAVAGSAYFDDVTFTKPDLVMTGKANIVCRGTLFKAGKLRCIIDNFDRSNWVSVDSVQLTDELNARNNARFRLNIPSDATDKPIVGSIVEFGNGVSTQYSGTIERMKKTMLGRSGVVFYDTEAVDWTQVCDRRLVARVFTNISMSDILYQIWNDYLRDEGLQLATHDVGPIINKAVFNYQTVTDCFNEIAELTGYAWYVDYAKTVHFINRDTLVAPFVLDETMGTAHTMDLAIEETRSQYRNKEYVYVTRATTTTKVQKFIGDGQTRSFSLTYPIAKAPQSIALADALGHITVQTVGLRGTDLDKDWYYSPDEKEITQNEDSQLWPSLTSLDTLVVTYQGTYRTLLAVQDDVEIAARMAIEGGTGLYERIENDGRIEELQQGTDYANALLRRYGVIPKSVNFRTDLQGLRPGQILTINMPTYGINYEDFLITELEATDVGGLYFRYTVTAVSGEFLGSWVDFFKALAGVSLTNNAYLIRDDEVILQTYTVAGDTFSVTEDIAVTQPTAIAQFGIAKIDRSEV